MCWHGSTLLDVSSRSRHTEHSNKSFSMHSSIVKRWLSRLIRPRASRSVGPSLVPPTVRTFLVVAGCDCTACTCSIETYSLLHLTLPIVLSHSLFLVPSFSLFPARPFSLTVCLSQTPAICAVPRSPARRKTDGLSQFVGLQFRHRNVTTERRNSIRFYSFVLPPPVLFFSSFLTLSLFIRPSRSFEGRCVSRPVPRNTHARRLFARSIDGLINDVSAVVRRRHGLGAHRGHGIDQSRASSIPFAVGSLGSCTRNTAVIIVHADEPLTATLPRRYPIVDSSRLQ